MSAHKVQDVEKFLSVHLQFDNIPSNLQMAACGKESQQWAPQRKKARMRDHCLRQLFSTTELPENLRVPQSADWLFW